MVQHCAPAGGKIIYATRSDADQAASQLRRRGRQQDRRGRLQPYLCEHAAHFHVGHARR